MFSLNNEISNSEINEQIDDRLYWSSLSKPINRWANLNLASNLQEMKMARNLEAYSLLPWKCDSVEVWLTLKWVCNFQDIPLWGWIAISFTFHLWETGLGEGRSAAVWSPRMLALPLGKAQILRHLLDMRTFPVPTEKLILGRRQTDAARLSHNLRIRVIIF